MQTIEEAQEFLRNNVENGVKCPCCKQMVKIYKRTIYDKMALNLIEGYRKYGREYFNIHSLSKYIGGDFAKLKYWGLVEQKTNNDESKKDLGIWRITEKGVLFVLEQTAVYKYVHIFDTKQLGTSGDMITIKDCLGKKFNYYNLMHGQS